MQDIDYTTLVLPIFNQFEFKLDIILPLNCVLYLILGIEIHILIKFHTFVLLFFFCTKIKWFIQ